MTKKPKRPKRPKKAQKGPNRPKKAQNFLKIFAKPESQAQKGLKRPIFGFFSTEKLIIISRKNIPKMVKKGLKRQKGYFWTFFLQIT